jgi:hypothetical protein
MGYYNDLYYSARDKRKKTAPPGKHIPDKNEARVLRKLMSQTGMSEDDIRTIPKYRKILSQSEKRVIDKKGANNQLNKFLEKIMKGVTREIKLPKEHPNVIDEFNKRVNKYKNDRFSRYSFMLRYYSRSKFIKL